MSAAKGYAATSPESGMAPFSFERRDLRPEDVAIEVMYCGVCHSDLHQAENDWHNTVYPCVPGHEIVGRITATGASANKFAVGDMVAIGCLVDSCQKCEPCHEGNEHFCEKFPTATYNGKDRQDGSPTYGGYSDHIVAREEFVLRLPDGLDPERAAPLLCAGITTWSPLRHWNVGPGTKVAVAGLGGLGHMGVKLAVALGADVTVITTSPSKEADARALGATDVLVSTDENAMKAAFARFDFILDTIPVPHDMAPYINLVAREGTLVLVGAIDMVPTFHSGALLMRRRSLAASMIGGIKETQELLDFCAANDVLPECETIDMKDINEGFERMKRNDVKYRFVVDMKTLADA